MTRKYRIKQITTQPDRVGPLPTKGAEPWEYEVHALKRTKFTGELKFNGMTVPFLLILDWRAKLLTFVGSEAATGEAIATDFMGLFWNLLHGDGPFALCWSEGVEARAVVTDADLAFGLLHKLKEQEFEV